MTVCTLNPSFAVVRLTVAALLAIFGLPVCASAQFERRGDSFEDREIIERNSDEILSSPEFQHFRRIPRRGPFGGPSGRGRAGEENGGGGGEGGGDAGGRDGRGRRADNARENRNGRNDDRKQGRNGNNDRADLRNDARRRTDRNFDRPSAPVSSFGGFGSGAAALFQALGWIVLAVMAGLIAYMIYKAIVDRERSVASEIQSGGTFQIGEIEPEHPPGELPADVYAAKARQLAQAGKYREAVAQLMLGAMSFVERSGLIRFRKGLTQRDYLRAVRRRKPAAESYKQMLRIYEPLGFGRREAQRQHFEASLESYTAGFHGREPVSQD